MDFTGLSDERGSRSVAGHGSSGVRDKRGRRPRSSTVHPGPVNVSRGGAMPSLTMNRAVGAVESQAAARETADRRQAEYFLCLLTQSRRHLDHRIGECQKAIAIAEAAGDLEGERNFRRMARSEEQDRQTLDGLIENLRRRFGLRVPGEVSKIHRTARTVVR
jgi:hypothetical protein